MSPQVQLMLLQSTLRQLGSRWLSAVLLGCVALIVAVLAAIGVYAVMSYLAALKTAQNQRRATGRPSPQRHPDAAAALRHAFTALRRA